MAGTGVEVKIAGRPLVCQVCGNRRFHSRRTLLNTPGLTFFSLDWLNRDALNHICDQCGFMMWFLEPES